MKVCVFGGSGFLGGHVADAASDAGHAVTIFDIRPSPYLRDDQKMEVGDILDEKSLTKAIRGCDVVYHFAGVADIDEAKDKPVETVKYNILGTTILLNCCVREKVKRFMFASSVYVYSKAGSFYRSSKQACELLIENFYDRFGLGYTVLRYGSLYGPRADAHNGLYRLLEQAMRMKKIIFHGSGEEIREFIHVQDAARLSIETLKPRYKNEYVILTGHQPMKMKDLFEMINEMMGHKVKIMYNNNISDVHYNITPYVFNPHLGKKLVGNLYIDMGQGVLQCLSDIHAASRRKHHRDVSVTRTATRRRKEKR